MLKNGPTRTFIKHTGISPALSYDTLSSYIVEDPEPAAAASAPSSASAAPMLINAKAGQTDGRGRIYLRHRRAGLSFPSPPREGGSRNRKNQLTPSHVTDSDANGCDHAAATKQKHRWTNHEPCLVAPQTSMEYVSHSIWSCESVLECSTLSYAFMSAHHR